MVRQWELDSFILCHEFFSTSEPDTNQLLLLWFLETWDRNSQLLIYLFSGTFLFCYLSGDSISTTESVLQFCTTLTTIIIPVQKQTVSVRGEAFRDKASGCGGLWFSLQCLVLIIRTTPCCCCPHTKHTDLNERSGWGERYGQELRCPGQVPRYAWQQTGFRGPVRRQREHDTKANHF